MSYEIRLAWKVAAELTPEGVSAALPVNGLLFNRKGGRSFLRSLGGDFRGTHAPVVLEPTDAFHRALSALREEVGFEGNRFPVSLELDPNGPRVQLNISLRLYGTFLCATCALSDFEVPDGTDFSRIQRLSSHPRLLKFIDRVCAIALKGDLRATSSGKTLKIVPCLRIVARESDAPTWMQDLVGIVTRHPGADLIVDAVLQKNDRHQIDGSRLLFDKQGVAGYVPSGTSESSNRAHSHRFSNAAAMLEYSLMMQKLLSTRQWVTAETQEAIRAPEEAVPNSVSARHIWALAVAEFSLQAELKSWTAASVPPVRSRVLLMTVTSTESRALHAAFQSALGVRAKSFKVAGFRYQPLGQLGDSEIVHAISGMGSGGLAGSQEAARRSISALQPDAVIMVGIAFGADPENQDIGDVLVSRQVQLYELQRVNSDGSVHARGDKVTASPMLLDWVAHAELTWDDKRAKIRTGLVLSGDKLIDNLEFRRALSEREPEAIGGEMEAAGIYVACQSAQIPWLVVKSICDWADGDKGNNKKANQSLAAATAAEFVLRMLKG